MLTLSVRVEYRQQIFSKSVLPSQTEIANRLHNTKFGTIEMPSAEATMTMVGRVVFLVATGAAMLTIMCLAPARSQVEATDLESCQTLSRHRACS